MQDNIALAKTNTAFYFYIVSSSFAKKWRAIENLLLHSPLKHLYVRLFLGKGSQERPKCIMEIFQAAQDYVN